MPSRPAASPPSRPLRCFVGLPLPESWQAGLARLTAGLERLTTGLAPVLASRLSWTRPGNGHLTLKFLGNVDEAQIPALVEALRGIAFAPLDLAVGRAGIFPPSADSAAGRAGRRSPRALWLGLAQGEAQCARLAAAVEQALLPLGFAPEARPYNAHLTLARVKALAPGDDWGAVQRTLDELATAGAAWPRARITSFVLWQSLLGPDGPTYVPLAEFPARQA